MKTEAPIGNVKVDRIATLEEIQVAIELITERPDVQTGDVAMEIPLDRGGYVRISAEELECASLIGELTRFLK